MAEDLRLLLALLTLAQCRKSGGGDASSSRSLCKALADRLPYWDAVPSNYSTACTMQSAGPEFMSMLTW